LNYKNILKIARIEFVEVKSKSVFLLWIICLVIFLSNFVFSIDRKRQKSTREDLSKHDSLLYLPLDERFTTRDLFLSNAEITTYRISTPEKSMLPRKKILPDIDALLEWTQKAAKDSKISIISADMFLYGGLIASRISVDSYEAVRTRLKILENIHLENPQLQLFVSSTVMRTPAYPSAEEEPDYYGEYGRQIFLFSFHTHRYDVLHDPKDKTASDAYKNQIPQTVLNDFLTRRARNFSVNKDLIKMVEKNVIKRLVITLDDNAEYGFSRREAVELEKLAAPFRNRIAIYHGADEAQLTLLSNIVAAKKPVSVFPVYRFPQSKNLIPAFEGEPLAASVKQQISAAGGYVENDLRKADCILYINNFEEKETFPPKNKIDLPADAKPLEDWLKRTGINSIGRKILILADNRFYNGADTEVIAALFKSKINSKQIAYAGWNTSGNTLGSSIALGVLRARMAKNASNFSRYRKLLFARFIEDWVYMTIGRDRVRNDLQQQNLKEFAGTKFEREYELKMKDLFNLHAVEINRFLKSNFNITEVFFPWHRSFEVGFTIKSDETSK